MFVPLLSRFVLHIVIFPLLFSLVSPLLRPPLALRPLPFSLSLTLTRILVLSSLVSILEFFSFQVLYSLVLVLTTVGDCPQQVPSLSTCPGRYSRLRDPPRKRSYASGTLHGGGGGRKCSETR